MAAEVFKSISHPERLSIVEVLSPDKKSSVTEIYESLRLPQAKVSHHLTILKNKGILISEKKGKNIFYSLSNPGLAKVLKTIEKYCEG
ncbi:MAG TPA: metalloregulator ArsR/SmtB family transcription factor [Ignavibacteria bacterium]|nr:metalloregulator ArsR/SmtB family transcription factor [Ignavibacteria bacterium]